MIQSMSWMEGLAATTVRHSSSMPVVSRQVYSETSSFVRPFNEIPGLWKNGVANLYNFWKLDGFKNLHRIMVQNFNTFGPIYRYERRGVLCVCCLTEKIMPVTANSWCSRSCFLKRVS